MLSSAIYSLITADEQREERNFRWGFFKKKGTSLRYFQEIVARGLLPYRSEHVSLKTDLIVLQILIPSCPTVLLTEKR